MFTRKEPVGQKARKTLSLTVEDFNLGVLMFFAGNGRIQRQLFEKFAVTYYQFGLQLWLRSKFYDSSCLVFLKKAF